MAIPRKYRKSSDILASFSYTELSTGKAVQLFYGGEVSPQDWTLSGNTFHSHEITSKATPVQAGADRVVQDIDYDTLFLIPQTIDGKVLVNVTAGIKQGTGTTTISHYFKVYVRKWDGTTETDLGTGVADTETTASLVAGAVETKVFAIEVDVSNKLIKKGETLRITIEQHGWNESANPTYVFGQDPQGRDDPDSIIDSGEPTQLKIWIPFKVNV